MKAHAHTGTRTHTRVHQIPHGPSQVTPGERQVGRAPAWGGRARGRGSGSPHLQHVPRDVLLAAVTADAKLGVVVGFTVRQPVPATSQASGPAGAPHSPPAPHHSTAPGPRGAGAHRLQHGLLHRHAGRTRGTGKIAPFRGWRN